MNIRLRLKDEIDRAKANEQTRNDAHTAFGSTSLIVSFGIALFSLIVIGSNSAFTSIPFLVTTHNVFRCIAILFGLTVVVINFILCYIQISTNKKKLVFFAFVILACLLSVVAFALCSYFAIDEIF